MGTGDWNDGMNKVGAEGKGESVWNGWFMLATLREFAGLAAQRGDATRATWCRERADSAARGPGGTRVGRRAGTAAPTSTTALRSARRTNDECQIDSIAQSWAVISGGGDPARARQAMAAVEERLVRDADGLILLFTPPFDRGRLEPGYIKGYVPGIRENGGQYTHAATWVVLATALLGQGQRAAELFDLLNPVRHAASPEGVARYKVEPYVVCADVYGAPPHTGRGGWTWYTGSASWLYRVGLEAILGFPPAGRPAGARSLRPARLARLRDHLPPRLGHLPHRCRERRGRRPRGPKRDGRWARRCRRASSNWRTTAHSTRSGLCSDRDAEGGDVMEPADRPHNQPKS